MPTITFNPDNIRYEFTRNTDSKDSSSGNTSAGFISMVWMVALAAGAGVVLFILVIVVRLRHRSTGNDAFILKAAAGGGIAEEWINPLAFKTKRNVAFDNPIYDYLDSMA